MEISLMYLLSPGIKLLCDQLFNPTQTYCIMISKWIQCFYKWSSDLMYSYGPNVCVPPPPQLMYWNPNLQGDGIR